MRCKGHVHMQMLCGILLADYDGIFRGTCPECSKRFELTRAQVGRRGKRGYIVCGALLGDES